MNNWVRISNEELGKSKEIIGLKKGELQIELVKALVKIDKAIEYIESYLPNYDFDKTNLKKVLGILKGEKDD